MKKITVEMPDDWSYAQCILCGSTPEEKGACGIDIGECPLSHAVKEKDKNQYSEDVLGISPDGKPPANADLVGKRHWAKGYHDVEEFFKDEAKPTANADPVNGDTSDGYHTFNELYDHRIALYLALSNTYPDKFWKAKKHEDGSCFEGWFILGGNLGTGDISYHLPILKWDMANCQELPLGKKWDGHTAADVVDRISRYRPVPVVKEQGEEGWKECAAQMSRNADYYRGLVIKIGAMFGSKAYIADDGSKSQGVLCAKVPELVEEVLRAPAPVASGLVEHLEGMIKKETDYIPGFVDGLKYALILAKGESRYSKEAK